MEKLIIDTDIGNDCDDAGALALCHALCERGEAELLAVTACLSTPYVAGCIDAINRHYGRTVPIGENFSREEKRAQFDEGGCAYDKIVFERFNKGYKTNRQESLRVLRKTLAEAEDGSVTLVSIGYLTSLSQLITSLPDEISALSGKELVSKKVKRTVVMGGRFYETWPMDIVNGLEKIHAEFNIIKDITAAQTVCKEWCGELVFSSMEIGNYCRTLRDMYKRAEENPVGLSYSVYPWAKEKGRESWDLTAVLYAIRPDAEYWYTHPKGKISVDNDGVTTFETRQDGEHTYLIPKIDYKQLEEVIDEIVKSSKYY